MHFNIICSLLVIQAMQEVSYKFERKGILTTENLGLKFHIKNSIKHKWKLPLSEVPSIKWNILQNSSFLLKEIWKMVSFAARYQEKGVWKIVLNTGRIFARKAYRSQLQTITYHLSFFLFLWIINLSTVNSEKVSLYVGSKVKSLGNKNMYFI